MADEPESMQDVDVYAQSDWKPQLVEFAVQDEIAQLTLNRPPANVLSIDVMEDICSAVDSIEFERDVKLLVLRAKGKYFCAGFELTDHLGDRGYLMLEAFRRIFEGLAKIDKPSVAIVNGPALGAGCLLAAGCDVALAAASAKFGHPEIKAGVFNTVAAALLPRLVGRKRALELILGGGSLTATEAEGAGLITRTVPDDKLEAEAEALLKKLRDTSPVALHSVRRAVAGGMDLPFLDAVRHAEDIYLNQLMLSEDAKEGLKAVMEKRKPKWVGR
jgi:cyclohexa-1,5-dienecarbonyl-CoA hydratase